MYTLQLHSSCCSRWLRCNNLISIFIKWRTTKMFFLCDSFAVHFYPSHRRKVLTSSLYNFLRSLSSSHFCDDRIRCWRHFHVVLFSCVRKLMKPFHISKKVIKFLIALLPPMNNKDTSPKTNNSKTTQQNP